MSAVDATVAGFRDQAPAKVGTAGASLEPTTTTNPEREASVDPLIGQRVGPFLIENTIASGGMGTVYRATQSEPIRRQVAVKMIRAGVADEAALRRFEAEQQALAIVDHADIAKIFEAGKTKLGEPYLAMEYCDGEPLDRFCEALSVRERIELVARVARAVQHAHGRGVIHRDLKPSNILVAQTGNEVNVKIIDFGIARFVDDQWLTANSDSTQAGELVGTPAYMAPEQIGGNTIDGRADVFSLGAILFRLLTGSTPLQPPSGNSSIASIVASLRDFDAITPSERLATNDTAGATKRRKDKQLRAALTADLDWIVLRATEAERTRRYATAGDFADDLQRYLNHEPVTAVAPGIRYRVAKFYQRRKPLVLASAAVISTVLIAGTAFAVDWWNRREQQLTEIAKVETECAPLLASVLSVREQVDEKTRNPAKPYARAREALSKAEALVSSVAVDEAVRARLNAARNLIAADTKAIQFAHRLKVARDQAAMPNQRTTGDSFGTLSSLKQIEAAFQSIGADPQTTEPPEAAKILQRLPAFLLPDVTEALDFVIYSEHIGAGLYLHVQDGRFTVAEAVAGGPAAATGKLREGDRLLAVNELDLTSLTQSEQLPTRGIAYRELTQPPGKRVHIRAARVGAEAFEVELTCRGAFGFWANAVLEEVDPEPWRDRLRNAILISDGETLRMLSNDPRRSQQRAFSLVMLGGTRYLLERSNEALEPIFAAQRRFPDDFWANHYTAMAWVQSDSPMRFERSLQYFTSAVALRPDSVGARVNLADACLLIGDRKAAAAHYAAASQLDRGNAELARQAENLTRFIRSEGSDSGAGSPAQQPSVDLVFETGSIEQLEAQARQFAAQGDRASAMKVLQQVSKNYADDPLALRARGAVLCDLQDYVAARVVLSDAARRNPSDAATRFYHGVSLQYSGDSNAAMHEYKAALALRPDYSAVHAFLDPLLAASATRAE